MMIKSALMTTGYDVPERRPDLRLRRRPRRPNKAADPGLVFDSGFADWLAFLKGQRLIANNVPALDASDLNQASIAIGDLAGSQTVTRTAKSVGSQSETYSFSFSGLAGITATPSAATFTAAPGPRRSSASRSSGRPRRSTPTSRASSPGRATRATSCGCPS